MNKILTEIQASRPDLSDYLYHFTKSSNATETLWKILADEKIIDVRGRGYICFTESPIYQMLEMFKIFEKYKKPMYAPFGIAIPKWQLFSSGIEQLNPFLWIQLLKILSIIALLYC